MDTTLYYTAEQKQSTLESNIPLICGIFVPLCCFFSSYY